ncbi:MAG: amino acid transport protein [Planctomycetota bacterium]|nr:MAG: amino acid transport protein [Planctomycetota bacterium]
MSVGTLFASLVVSSVGFGFFLYGKKQGRMPHLIVGLVMSAFPYFVAGPLAMCSISGALVLALFVAVRSGL